MAEYAGRIAHRAMLQDASATAGGVMSVVTVHTLITAGWQACVLQQVSYTCWDIFKFHVSRAQFRIACGCQTKHFFVFLVNIFCE